MKRILLILALAAAPLTVDARSPTLSPKDLAGLLQQNLVPGTVKIINGDRYIVDDIKVHAEGNWVVIKILPRRLD